MTPQVVAKLEEAFLLGCTDLEACFFANISKDTLYNYQNKNPEFIERKERLKSNPVFKARRSVLDHIDGDGNLAMKYLERKCKDEFGLKNESVLTGANGAPLIPEINVNIVKGGYKEDNDTNDTDGTDKQD